MENLKVYIGKKQKILILRNPPPLAVSMSLLMIENANVLRFLMKRVITL